MTDHKSPRKWRHWPSLLVMKIIFLSIVLRLLAVYTLKGWDNPNAMEHHALAANVLLDDGFKIGGFGYYGYSSVQSPVYPYLLAGIYLLWGIGSNSSYLVAMTLNSLLGGVCVWLTYLLVLELGGNKLTAFISCSLCAVWPSQIYVVTHVQAVVLITVFLLIMWIMFIRGLSKKSLSSWCFFSVVTAVGILTEPVFLLIGFGAGIAAIFWRDHSFNMRFRNGLILLATTSCIVGPWTFRNYKVHARLIPVKSSFWVNVWKGNNEYATGSDRLSMNEERLKRLQALNVLEAEKLARDHNFDKDSHQYSRLSAEQMDRIQGKPEIDREDVFKEWAIKWIKENPSKYAKLCWIRLVKTLLVDWDNPKAIWIALAIRIVLLGLVVPGLILSVKQGWYIGFPIVSIVICLVLFSLTITASRFSIPLEPFAFALGGLTLSKIVFVITSKPPMLNSLSK